MLRVIARFEAPAGGEIVILETRGTGARVYREGGVEQSRVLPGGETGIAYVRLMAALLDQGRSALLLGCGGGALGSMLHRRGLSVVVVDNNPVSFELARTFFWMPDGLECISRDMRDVVRSDRRKFDGIGIDVGGPSFCYDEVLGLATVSRIRERLRNGGRIAVNISCDAPDDPVPVRIAERFARQGLGVWMFKDQPSAANEVNAIILASARDETPAVLAGVAGPDWSLAQLA